jgi:tRNA threonylcarbamoyladenosine biosynthesis protein TsaE
MPSTSQYLEDEAATLRYGERLAARLREPALRRGIVFLHGQLGAGKTTLVRGILRAFGHAEAVKSPTYTLLEPYEEVDPRVYHFDFYRIGDSAELDFIGIDELLDDDAIKLIEWPELAGDRLPPPDVDVYLSLEGKGRRIDVTIR